MVKIMSEADIQNNSELKITFTQEEIEHRKCELREKNRRDKVAIIEYVVKQAIEEEREKYTQAEKKRVVRLIEKGKSLEDIMGFFAISKEHIQQILDEHQ